MNLSRAAAGLLLACSPLLVLGCSSGKPPVEDVHAGLMDIYVKSSGLTPEQATAMADCAAPKLHDKLDTEALNQISDGQDPQDDSQAKLATDVILECAAEVGGGEG